MYMKLYMTVEEIVLTDETVNRHSVLEDSVKLYLKLKKKGKTHRSVLDRNRKDVLEIEKGNAIYVSEGGMERKSVVKSELIGLLVGKMNNMLGTKIK